MGLITAPIGFTVPYIPEACCLACTQQATQFKWRLSVGFKKISYFLAFTSLLSGCSTMLSNNRISDDVADNQGKGFAFAVTCAEKKMIPEEVVYSFGVAINRLHAVSVVNYKKYAEAYRKTKEELKSYPHAISKNCRELGQKIPALTQEFIARESKIISHRQAGAAELTQAMSNFGKSVQQNAPAYNDNYNVQQPNFGLPDNKTQNYLIHGLDSGNKMCSVSSSGVVFCR